MNDQNLQRQWDAYRFGRIVEHIRREPGGGPVAAHSGYTPAMIEDLRWEAAQRYPVERPDGWPQVPWPRAGTATKEEA